MTPSTPQVFTGHVWHSRLAVTRHSFRRPIMLAYLDVEQLPDELDGLPWWSARRRALIHWQARDYFDGSTAHLGPALRDLVSRELGVRPAGPIHQLTSPRTAGWLFNPLSAYYCREPDGRLTAVVLEVTNTPWGERHWYVLDARGKGRAEVAKQLHVSPFFQMNQRYLIRWCDPRQHLDLAIKVVEDERVVFVAGIAGDLAPLTRANARTLALRYPLQPLQVSGAIYWQALRLFSKGVPFHGHPRGAAGQLGGEAGQS